MPPGLPVPPPMPAAQEPPVARSVPSPEIESEWPGVTRMPELPLPEAIEDSPWSVIATGSLPSRRNAQEATFESTLRTRSWSSISHDAFTHTRTWPSTFVPASV